MSLHILLETSIWGKEITARMWEARQLGCVSCGLRGQRCCRAPQPARGTVNPLPRLLSTRSTFMGTSWYCVCCRFGADSPPNTCSSALVSTHTDLRCSSIVYLCTVTSERLWHVKALCSLLSAASCSQKYTFFICRTLDINFPSADCVSKHKH